MVRILCDQHVARKYVTAFEQSEEITVGQVKTILSADAPDAAIIAEAEANDWVVFTNDADFQRDTISHGLLVYSQIENPSPTDVIAAIQSIEHSYDANEEIREFVPDGWI